MMDNGIITDYDIQALVDNELTPEEEGRVRRYLNANQYAKKRYLELCRQKEMLHDWWSRKIKH